MDRKTARAKDDETRLRAEKKAVEQEEAWIAEQNRKKQIAEMASTIVEGINFILKEQFSKQITKEDIDEAVGNIKPPVVNVPVTTIPPFPEIKIDLKPIEKLLVEVLTELRKPEEEKQFVLKLV